MAKSIAVTPNPHSRITSIVPLALVRKPSGESSILNKSLRDFIRDDITKTEVNFFLTLYGLIYVLMGGFTTIFSSFVTYWMAIWIIPDLSKQSISLFSVLVLLIYFFSADMSLIFAVKAFNFHQREDNFEALSWKEILRVVWRRTSAIQKIASLVFPFFFPILDATEIPCYHYRPHIIIIVTYSCINLIYKKYQIISIKHYDTVEGRVLSSTLRQKKKLELSPWKLTSRVSTSTVIFFASMSIYLVALTFIPSTIDTGDNINSILFLLATYAFKSLILYVVQTKFLKLEIPADRLHQEGILFQLTVDTQIRVLIGSLSEKSRIIEVTLQATVIEMVFRLLSTIMVKRHLYEFERKIADERSDLSNESDSKTKEKALHRMLSIKLKNHREAYLDIQSSKMYGSMVSEYIALAIAPLIISFFNERGSSSVHVSFLLFMYQVGIELMTDFIMLIFQAYMGIPVFLGSKTVNLNLMFVVWSMFLGILNFFIGMLLFHQKMNL